MKMMLRKTLALLLCISLCVSYVPIAVADNVASGTWGNLSWTLDNNGKLTISGNGEMQNFYGASNDAWKPYQDQITTIEIRNGVTSVSNHAFYACYSLSDISLPSTLTSIGDMVFFNCNGLTSIDIPANVISISSNAFTNCPFLASFQVNASNNTFSDYNGILMNKEKTTLLCFPNAHSLDNAFPTTMKSIGQFAFTWCDMTSLNIPEGVTSIGVYAFDLCKNLGNITLPSSITDINLGAFNRCTQLADVYYNGTQAQWNAINISSTYNEPLTNATLHVQEESQITPPVAFLYTPDAAKEFDGNPLVMDPGTATSVITDSEGRYFKAVIEYAGGSITNIGSIENPVTSYALYDMNDTLLFSQAELANYPNFRVVNGTLTVTEPTYKAPLTVRGVSTTVTATQQGQVFYASALGGELGYTNGYQVEGLLSGHEISGSNIVTGNGNASFTATVHQNAIRVIRTSDGQDVTPLYDIQTIDGSVTVIPYEQGEQPEIDTGSGISVVESTGDPVITSFKFYQDVDGTEYLDMTDSTDTLAVDYNGSTDPYKFVITVDEPELINHIYVNGDAQDESHQMEATYDSNIGAFVAEGYFDESNIYYQPEDIKLEYSVKSSAPKVGENLNWDEMVPYLNELNNASITVDEEGDTNSGSIDFSGVADGINDMALDYVIKTIDSSTGTKIQELKQEYETAAGILSYVVPGLDNSKYIVYLDQNDPHTWKMLLSDGLDVAEKAIEIQMTFEDPTSSQYINMVDALDNLGKVSTVANTAYKAYKINKETAELHSEIDRCTTIKEADKDRAHEKAQELHHDKMQFMLLTVTLPILVTTGAVMGPAPAMLFSAIIGAMSATSNVIFDYRVGGILGAEKNAQWYPNLSHTTGIQCGENAYYDYYTYRVNGILLKDIVVYGSGSTYNEYDWDPYLPGYTKNIHVQNGITSLGSRFFWGFQGVQTIKLPSSLSEIGWEAFRDCADLTRISIPNGVKTIGSGAFRECTNLGRMDLPDSVECIESGAFSGCESLKVIKLSNNLQTLGAGVFTNTDIREITIPNSLKEVVRTLSIISPFEGSNISTIVFEDGIKTIPDHVALNSENLRQVVIPDSVETIGEGAFNNCSKIENIDLPESLKSIGTRAFAYCASLSSIAIPSSVTSIGEGAFNYSGLTDITVDASNTVYCDINGVLFNKSQTSILQFPAGRSGQYSIPSSVTTIGDYAFCSCSGLTSIIIPFGVTSIGYAAFIGCSGLVSIMLPLSVTSIDWFAFSECTGLTNVTIPASLTAISAHMFSDCSSLASVTIPSSVTNIDNCAFDGCSGLTSIMIPIAVTRIGRYAFRGCSSLADVYYEGTQQQWNNIVISNDNNPLENADIHFNSFILPTPDFILPAELTVIGNEAFRGGAFSCVKLSDKTTQIGTYAFADCQNLKYIYISAKTTSIAANAFGNMSNLTIIGESGTIAESYARNHNYQFVAVP